MENQTEICSYKGVKYFPIDCLDDDARKVAHQSWMRFMQFESDKTIIDDEGFVIDTSFTGFKKSAVNNGLVFSKNGKHVYWLDKRHDLIDTESHDYEH